MPTSAETYASLVDAYSAQMARLSASSADRWASRASQFRLDPRRELEANTKAALALIRPDDVVIDVGGGAGRVALPVALHCTEVINVEPSIGMREQFDASAKEAGISNARCIDGGWPSAAAGLSADVVMLANVTYFVRDIVPFVEALNATARRLVIIAVWSVPPPNHHTALFELLHGEPQARVPTHRELLPVLWDMGLLPDVRVLPDPFRHARMRPPTREDALRFALDSASATNLPNAEATVRKRFAGLFRETPEGFMPTWLPDTREMLITWEAG
ncbi:MAG: hypothetical protein C0506_14905 [Anaerolinea sp.]|nr:hypothetical protein [Anaerolinea sp.]